MTTILAPLFLGCCSLAFSKASVQAHEAIPTCRYRDLRDLTTKSNLYAGLALGLGLFPLMYPPVGLFVATGSLGYMAYKYLA